MGRWTNIPLDNNIQLPTCRCHLNSFRPYIEKFSVAMYRCCYDRNLTYICTLEIAHMGHA
jgi:hypothetical protein